MTEIRPLTCPECGETNTERLNIRNVMPDEIRETYGCGDCETVYSVCYAAYDQETDP